MTEITGGQFGRWTVLGRADQGRYWRCVCQCGTVRDVLTNSLVRGKSVSCGCYKRECTSKRTRIHGRSNTRVYRIWLGMIRRCCNPSNPGYQKWYGSRGIKVCERWRASFVNFLADMGEPPTAQHSIERKDNDGDYCPENCEWALPGVQSNNKRTNINLTFNGKTQTVAQWAQELHIPRDRLYGRVRRGCDGQTALTLDKFSRERAANCILTAAKVRAIRAHVGPQREIAKEFGISRCHVSAIRARKKWQHVT